MAKIIDLKSLRWLCARYEMSVKDACLMMEHGPEHFPLKGSEYEGVPEKISYSEPEEPYCGDFTEDDQSFPDDVFDPERFKCGPKRPQKGFDLN